MRKRVHCAAKNAAQHAALHVTPTVTALLASPRDLAVTATTRLLACRAKVITLLRSKRPGVWVGRQLRKFAATSWHVARQVLPQSVLGLLSRFIEYLVAPTLFLIGGLLPEDLNGIPLATLAILGGAVAVATVVARRGAAIASALQPGRRIAVLYGRIRESAAYAAIQNPGEYRPVFEFFKLEASLVVVLFQWLLPTDRIWLLALFGGLYCLEPMPGKMEAVAGATGGWWWR